MWGGRTKGYAHVEDGVDGDVELEFAFNGPDRPSEGSDASSTFMVSNLRMPSLSSKDLETGKRQSVQSTKLSTFSGVTVPCLLNILGIILYLRLGWAVGQLGIVGLTAAYTLAGITVILTTLSISAIATNGVVKGGGAYFLISRTLGPELGGSVGLCLYLGNAIGVTFYLTGFSDTLTQSIFEDDPSYRMKLGISSAALLVLTGISLMGAQVFSKLNVLVLCSELTTIMAAIVSFAFGSKVGGGDTEGYVGFGGWDPVTNSTRAPLDTFRDNLLPEYSEGMHFFSVFAVIFPSVTGIMAGANMSGDLKDPGKSLGRGTLTAIAHALSIYLIMFLLMGSTTERATLKGNVHLLQDACFSPSLISFGILVSSASSGLGSMCGAGRILQALARDRLLSPLDMFAQGSTIGDEPQMAIWGTWCIAQTCLFIGSLDTVASILTNFFLVTYFATNLSVCVLKMTGAPNFRPRFRYFSWKTSLTGAILCLVIMFLSGPLYAFMTLGFLGVLFLHILYFAPPNAEGWGDVTQALIFHQVRKMLLHLDERKSHPKFWRPSILLLPNMFHYVRRTTPQDQPPPPPLPAQEHREDDAKSELLPLQPEEEFVNMWMAMFDFCNNLKKNGLYVVGDTCVGDLDVSAPLCPRLQGLWNQLIGAAEIKAFSVVCPATTYRDGCFSLMMTAGLGGMRPNSVMFALPPRRALSDRQVPMAKRAENKTAPPSAVVLQQDAVGKQEITIDSMRGKRHFSSSSSRPRDLRDTFSLLLDTHEVAKLKQEYHNSRRRPTRSKTRAGLGTLRQCQAQEFCACVQDALRLQMNVLVGVHFEHLDKDLIVNHFVMSCANANGTVNGTDANMSESGILGRRLERLRRKFAAKGPGKMTIDVWCFDLSQSLPEHADEHANGGFSGHALLQLQLANVLHRTDYWQEYTQIRFVYLPQWTPQLEEERVLHGGRKAGVGAQEDETSHRPPPKQQQATRQLQALRASIKQLLVKSRICAEVLILIPPPPNEGTLTLTLRPWP
jgi:amino acid transporter